MSNSGTKEAESKMTVAKRTESLRTLPEFHLIETYHPETGEPCLLARVNQDKLLVTGTSDLAEFDDTDGTPMRVINTTDGLMKMEQSRRTVARLEERIGLARVGATTDTERLDWLDIDSDRLEDVRGRMNDDEETVREAIDFLAGEVKK